MKSHIWRFILTLALLSSGLGWIGMSFYQLGHGNMLAAKLDLILGLLFGLIGTS